MIPLQLTLKIYHSNRVRLGMVKLPIPTNLTRWINEAMAKRLDSEHPETIGAVEAVPADAEKPLNPAEIYEEHKKAARAARPLKLIGPYRVLREADSVWRTLAEVQIKKAKKLRQIIGLEEALERAAEANDAVLSEDEKIAIMAEYNQKQMEAAKESKMESFDEIPDDVKGHPRKYAAWDAKRRAAEANFWGEAV